MNTGTLYVALLFSVLRIMKIILFITYIGNDEVLNKNVRLSMLKFIIRLYFLPFNTRQIFPNNIT